MNLEGKVAIITGASRGIGRAIAEQLGQARATVVVNYANQAAKAEEVVETIKQAGGSAIAIQGDMSKVAEIEALFAKTKEHFGHIDIVVNNAGRGLFKPHAEITEAEFDSILSLNTKGAFFVMQQAAKHITDGGRIVNIVTGGTKMPIAAGGLYAGSKAASELFALSLSKELGARGITVNNVSPGVTATDSLVLPPPALEQLKQQTPLGCLRELHDIANVVAFLVSEALLILGMIFLSIKPTYPSVTVSLLGQLQDAEERKLEEGAVAVRVREGSGLCGSASSAR